MAVCGSIAAVSNPPRKQLSWHSFPNPAKRRMITGGGEAAPVGRPDFKPGWGRRAILGRFDSCSLPPAFPSRLVHALFHWAGPVAQPPPPVALVQQAEGNDLYTLVISQSHGYCSFVINAVSPLYFQPGEEE